ncbi:MAG: S-layer homology domain-containing protein [Oscillospiraceae bacterium]|nr:S-layer homology domain-containing protein [Oscillospiraceae bacterium]
MKKLKGMISLLLCAVMVFGLMPSAFALGGEAEQAQVIEPAAQIETKEAAEAEKLAAVLPGEAPAVESEEELEEEEAAAITAEVLPAEDALRGQTGVIGITVTIDAGNNKDLEQRLTDSGTKFNYTIEQATAPGEASAIKPIELSISGDKFEKQTDGTLKAFVSRSSVPVGNYYIYQKAPSYTGFELATVYSPAASGETDRARVTLPYVTEMDALSYAGATVANTYTEANGTLKITKTFKGLTSLSQLDSEAFLFVLHTTGDVVSGPAERRVTFNGTTFSSEYGTVTMLTGDDLGFEWTLTVPAGEYRVKEDAPAAGYTLDIREPGRFTVEKGKETSVSFVNEYSQFTRRIMIYKTVEGLQGSDKMDDRASVTLAYAPGQEAVPGYSTFTLYYKDFSVGQDGVLYYALTTGYPGVYNVTENYVDVDGYALKIDCPKQITYQSEGTTYLNITNHYEKAEATLLISKVIEGIDDEDFPQDAEFIIEGPSSFNNGEPLKVKFSDFSDHYTTEKELESGKWGVEGYNYPETSENPDLPGLIVPIGKYTITEKADTVQKEGYELNVGFKDGYWTHYEEAAYRAGEEEASEADAAAAEDTDPYSHEIEIKGIGSLNGVLIVNWYRGKGDIEITKTFTGLPDGVYPENFKMHVQDYLEAAEAGEGPGQAKDAKKTSRPAADTRPTVTYTTDNGFTANIGTVTATENGYVWTIPGYYTGSYYITEENADYTGYFHDYIGPDEVTVENGQTAKVSIQNDYTQGTRRLKIIKRVSGLLGNDELSPDVIFTLTPVEEASAQKATEKITVPFSKFELIGTGTNNTKIYSYILTDDDIPAGTYNVSESAHSIAGYDLMAEKRVRVIVPETGEATVTLHNSYVRQYGYLLISKMLEGLAIEDFPTGTKFKIEGPSDFGDNGVFEFTFDDFIKKDGEFVYNELDTDHDGHSDKNGLNGYNYVDPDGEYPDRNPGWKVPAGVYTITEDRESAEVTGYDLSISYRGGYVLLTKENKAASAEDPVELDDNQVLVQSSTYPYFGMTVTNRYSGYGSLVITKTFTDLPGHLFPVDFEMTLIPVLEAEAAYADDEEEYDEEEEAAQETFRGETGDPRVWFDIDSDCFFTNMNGEGDSIETLKDENGNIIGYVWTIASIPTGEYDIVESKADIGTFHADMVGPHSVIVKVGENEVVIDNQYSRYTRRLTITKRIIGLPEGVLPEDLTFIVEPHVEEIGPWVKDAKAEPVRLEIPFSDFEPSETEEGVYVYVLQDDNLIPGEYDIYEMYAGVDGYWLNNKEVTYTVNITEEGTFEVTFTNYYERMYGTLVIDKVLEGDLTPDAFLEKALGDVQFTIEGPEDFGENGVMNVILYNFERDENDQLIYYDKTPYGYRLTLKHIPSGIYTVTEKETGEHSAAIENYALTVSYKRGTYLDIGPINPPIVEEAEAYQEVYKEEYVEQLKKSGEEEAEHPYEPIQPGILLPSNAVEVNPWTIKDNPYMQVTNTYKKGAEVTITKQFTGLPDGVYPEDFEMEIVGHAEVAPGEPELPGDLKDEDEKESAEAVMEYAKAKKVAAEAVAAASEAAQADLAAEAASEAVPGLIILDFAPYVWYDAETGEFKASKGEIEQTEDGYIWTVTLAEGNYDIYEYDCEMTDYDWIRPESMPTIHVEFGKPVSVTVVNEYEARKTTLTVTKAFLGLSEDEIPADTLFTITDRDGKVVEIDGQPLTFTYGDMTNGEYVIENMPIGEYTITETPVEVDGYDRLTSFDEVDTEKWGVSLTKTITSKPYNGDAYAPGETIQYQIVVTNTGTNPYYKTEVIDKMIDLFWSPDNASGIFDKYEMQTFTGSHVVSYNDINKDGQIVNTAIFHAVYDPDNLTEILIEKEAAADVLTGDVSVRITNSPSGKYFRTNDTILFSVTARNTSDFTIKDYRVKVNINGEVQYFYGQNLEPGETKDFGTVSYVVKSTDRSVDYSGLIATGPSPDYPYILNRNDKIAVIIVNGGGGEIVQEEAEAVAETAQQLLRSAAKAGDDAGVADQLSYDFTLTYTQETEIRVKNSYYPKPDAGEARLVITKIVDLPDGADNSTINSKYNVSVNIIDAGTGKVVKEVTLGDFNNNTCTVIEDIAPGTYYIEEPAEGSHGEHPDLNGLVYVTTYDPADETNTGRAKITLAAGDTKYVEVTNTYSEGGIVVLTKTFEGLDGVIPDGFTLSVVPNGEDDTGTAAKEAVGYAITYKDGKYSTENGTFDKTDTGFIWTFAAEPGDYTVTEDKTDVEGYVFNVATFEPFTVKDLDTTEVTVTNSYTANTGYLQITKIIDISAVTDEAALAHIKGLLNGDRYTFKCYILDSEETEVKFVQGTVFELQNDGTYKCVLPAVELPVGQYTLAEEMGTEGVNGYANLKGYNVKAAYSERSVEITAANTENAPETATVTNTYTEAPGYLKITKKLGSEIGAVPEDTVFEIKDANDKVVKTLTYGEDFKDGAAVVELAYGTYTVEESNAKPLGFLLETAYSPAANEGDAFATVQVTYSNGKDNPAPVEVTNTYTVSGILKIVKVIEGTDQIPSDLTFTITGPDDFSITVDYNTDFTDGSCFIEVPQGDYTVTENGGEISGYALSTTVEGASGDDDENTAKAASTTIHVVQKHTESYPAVVTFTNTYIPIGGGGSTPDETGYLQITKVVDLSAVTNRAALARIKGIMNGDRYTFKCYILDSSGKEVTFVQGTDFVLQNDGTYKCELPAVALPLGQYKLLEEMGTAGVNGYANLNGFKVKVAYSDRSVDITAANTENAPVTSTVTNAYTQIAGGGDTPDTPTPPDLNGDDHFAYVIGYPDGCVHPEAEITRAEAVTIFFRLLKDDVRNKYWSETNSFSDVSEGQWFNHAVSTLAKMGIVSGYPDGTFKPGETITRAEFVALAARFDAAAEAPIADFSDISGHWASIEIAKAAANGWINGYPDGSFKPDQKINRAEAMALVNRVLNRDPADPDDLLNNMITWPDNMDKNAWFYLDVQEATNSHTYERVTKPTEKWVLLEQPRDWAALEY